MRPQVGQLINNKYRLVRLLGDGGMGSVFEATHEVLGSGVALKFLHPELARRQGLVQRFIQEARVSAKIHSNHVCRVVDVEQTPNGLPFMVMDLLKGKSLQTLYEDNYRAGVRLSYQEALDLAMQMLDGLEAAHEEGIVHRDLKPDNVMIITGKRGEQICKLLDFGIAKLKINGEATKGLTRPGVIMGTPEYMAPEQVFSADTVDARADVFSMGVMIFEMLAGRRPVGGDEAHQIAAAYISGNISKLRDLAPSVPQGLADVVHKAMAHDPKDRIQSVADLRAAIEPFAREAGIRATGSTPPPSPTNLPVGAHGTATPSAAALAQTASVAAIDGAETAKVSSPWRGDDLAAISAKLSKAAGNNFDSTVDGQPFFPGSTEAFQPASELAPEFASTVAASGQARPGGTDIGTAVLPNTANFGSHAIGPTPQVASYTPAAIPAHTAPRRKKGGLSVFSILGIAAAFTGLVVGGVYAYEEFGGGTSKNDKPKTVPLPSKPAPTVVEPSEPGPPPEVQQPPQQPTPTPPTVTTPPTRPPGPGPSPGPGPNPTTSTTSNKPNVPIIPSVLPPGIPTTLQIPTEWGIPGMGGGTPPPTPSSKPPSGGGKKPGRPGLEPIQEGALNPETRPDASHAEAPTRRVLRPARTEAAPSETRRPPTRTAREERRPLKRPRFKTTGL